MLFISKKVSYTPLLDFLEREKITLIDQSFIAFKKLPFECLGPSHYDIVFFSSPRSVHYFLESCRIPENKKVACIGASTRKALEDHNIIVHFEGVNSGAPEEVADNFKAFAKGGKVLFPQSNRSNRSVQKHMNANQVIDLIVYTTTLEPKKIDANPYILVFTSPSNAESFLKLNKVLEHQKVIAWGQTTEKFLLKQNINVYHTLKKSSFEELHLNLLDLIT
jgi:uroporphyrinogen-III synthase